MSSPPKALRFKKSSSPSSSWFKNGFLFSEPASVLGVGFSKLAAKAVSSQFIPLSSSFSSPHLIANLVILGLSARIFLVILSMIGYSGGFSMSSWSEYVL
jgi:hypothetical protein